jgi:adenine deaminase
MKILIREGSAAKNFEALIDLLNDYEDRMMFCSDDKHPDSLEAGHINQLCARAVAKGIDVFKVLKAACVNPVLHYNLDVGLLREGDDADFIIVKDLINFNVTETYIDGKLVAKNGKSFIQSSPPLPINHFDCSPKEPSLFVIKDTGAEKILVIEALDGQLITNKIEIPASLLRTEDGTLQTNLQHDILKIAVINRYAPAPIAVGWIKNFGFREGAIASTVAHDSHNIVAVGVDDESLCRAVNLVIAEKGGVSCVSGNEEKVLGLPVAGLISIEDGYKGSALYTVIYAMCKGLGSELSAPFMTLSFMALLVIPHIKLSDLGLFDGDSFRFFDAM